MVQSLLDAPTGGKPPFACLSFEHLTGEERLVPALFVGDIPRSPFVSDLVNVSFLVEFSVILLVSSVYFPKFLQGFYKP